MFCQLKKQNIDELINVDVLCILIRIDEQRVNKNFMIYIKIDDKTISRCFVCREITNRFQFSS